MTTKPKTRKAPAGKTTSRGPKETELDLPGHALLDAQDVFGRASNLADAISLIACELGKYECGAICSVADAIKTKISDGLDLIEAYRKESGLATRQVDAARKVVDRA